MPNNNMSGKYFIGVLAVLAVAALIYMLVVITGYYATTSELTAQVERYKKMRDAVDAYYESLIAYNHATPVLLNNPKLFDTSLFVTDAIKKTNYPESNVSITRPVQADKTDETEYVKISVTTKPAVDENVLWKFLVEVEKNDPGAIKVEQLILSRDPKEKSSSWKGAQILFSAYRTTKGVSK